MNKILIKDAIIVNEGKQFKGSILIENEFISEIFITQPPPSVLTNSLIVDATNQIVIPGVIDDHVHFREPGLTHKGDIYSESKASVAGGVTSFMDMPNTVPLTITKELLEEKYYIASQKSLANYSFYIGASNDNLKELVNTDPKNNCGIKLFMGSSTGNMLVNDAKTLSAIFAECPLLIAVHCEDENIIKANQVNYKSQFGDKIPVEYHPLIRTEEACFVSSASAIELADKYNSRLHILHVSTERELSLFSTSPVNEKKITAEVCPHYLWFNDTDYKKYGPKIKWNPAIKNESDRKALFEGLLLGKLDIIATDHAPHTIEEKQINSWPGDYNYFKSASGGPLIQHSLVAMFEFYHKKQISLEKIVEKMCHTPSEIFKINKRGYIRKGYYADLVIVNLNSSWQVNRKNLFYKCKWSPFEGMTFQSKVTHTFINGHLAFKNDVFDETWKGKRLLFCR